MGEQLGEIEIPNSWDETRKPWIVSIVGIHLSRRAVFSPGGIALIASRASSKVDVVAVQTFPIRRKILAA